MGLTDEPRVSTPNSSEPAPFMQCGDIQIVPTREGRMRLEGLTQGFPERVDLTHGIKVAARLRDR